MFYNVYRNIKKNGFVHMEREIGKNNVAAAFLCPVFAQLAVSRRYLNIV